MRKNFFEQIEKTLNDRMLAQTDPDSPEGKAAAKALRKRRRKAFLLGAIGSVVGVGMWIAGVILMLAIWLGSIALVVWVIVSVLKAMSVL